MSASPTVPLTVQLQPATKDRLLRCSKVTGVPMTRMLELAADGLEKGLLERLKPTQRHNYLGNKLSAAKVFGVNKLAEKTQTNLPRVPLSVDINVAAKASLERYARFWEIPFSHVIFRIARNWEKQVLARLSEAQREPFLRGELDRTALTAPTSAGPDARDAADEKAVEDKPDESDAGIFRRAVDDEGDPADDKPASDEGGGDGSP